ncbi:MAG: type II toxin-antitoxin system HicA family toxin [Thermoplasmatota archaeon]
MPKLPRDVSHDRVVRFLAKRGWAAEAGARHTLLHRGREQLTVPRHSLLTPGTLQSILKRARVPRDEWGEL